MAGGWDGASAIFTAVAAGAAWATAVAANNEVRENERLRKLEMRPVLGYQCATGLGSGDRRLWFLNMGKGAAQIRMVQSKEPFSIQIGAPLSVGSGGKAYLDVSLPEKPWPSRTWLHLSLYYTDIGGVCHRSEVLLDLHTGASDELSHTFVSSDRAVVIEGLTLPVKVTHWKPGMSPLEKTNMRREWWLQDA